MSSDVDYGRRAVSRPDREHDRRCPNAGTPADTGIATSRTLPARLAMCSPEGKAAPRGRTARCLADLTGGDKNMRYALVIAMLLGSTLLAQTESIDRDKWIAQTGKASNPATLNFGRNSGRTRATVTQAV